MIGDVITDDDRDYKKSIDKYISENGLKDDIFAPGFRRDIADILAATDCVVVPSSEGMPLTVLEAMSARTRVVGMNKGGSNELLTAASCGEVYSANGTEKDIADAVLRVMEQDREALDRGYQFCIKHSNQNYSKGVHGVFDSMK